MKEVDILIKFIIIHNSKIKVILWIKYDIFTFVEYVASHFDPHLAEMAFTFADIPNKKRAKICITVINTTSWSKLLLNYILHWNISNVVTYRLILSLLTKSQFLSTYIHITGFAKEIWIITDFYIKTRNKRIKLLIL